MKKNDREEFLSILRFHEDTDSAVWQQDYLSSMKTILGRNQNACSGDSSFSEEQWYAARAIVGECEKIAAARIKIDEIANSPVFA